LKVFDASEFTFLKNLREIDFSHDKLTRFPVGLHHLSKLRALNLDANGIRSFQITDSAIPKLRQLSKLWSEDNGLPASLHPYFLRMLEKFDVSYRIPERRASSDSSFRMHDQTLLQGSIAQLGH
jgi:Leucine-rich repeat (LRR) protein